MAEFREAKKLIMKGLKKHFLDVQLWEDERTEVTPVNFIEALDRFRGWSRFQKLGQFVTMPRTITRFRALLCSYMTNTNTGAVSIDEFVLGCNRFALDNPVPTITQRLAWYGNEENNLNQVFAWLERHLVNKTNFEKDQFTTLDLGENPDAELLEVLNH
jgi:hypothetical protein